MNEELGKLLYKTFFYNNRAYAIQDIIDDEVYFFTHHQRIDANKINYYIENKKSVLAYQQKFDKLNWVCLDFDIVKNIIVKYQKYDFINDEKYRPILLSEVEICCDYLNKLKINYLVEYSGNRGVHIWIFFDFPITKSLGFTIIAKIINDAPFKFINQPDSPIGIDLFPKVPSSKNNIVGKGVKIPMSYHLKSNSYSYLLESLTAIKRTDRLDSDIISEQIRLLRAMKKNDIVNVLEVLGINKLTNYSEYKKLKVVINYDVEEQTIIEDLRKSELFKYLFDNLSSLSESERRILVGTFARIQKDDDEKFGINLLKKVFSETENYNSEITELKIDLLRNLYPPNIAYVEKILKMKCAYCEAHEINNVTELLVGVEIRKTDYLNNIIKWAKSAEINYLFFNDEVPLNFIEDELKSIDETSLGDSVEMILSRGEFPEPVFYKYEREEETKNRVLYSLAGNDRVISTAIMKYIYDVIGVDTISPLSYSYRINSDSRNSIFMSWNSLWMEFIKEVQSCTNHNAYDDYYVIKLDVKSFYDSINLTLLKEIMTAKSNNGFQYNFLKLNISSLSDDVKRRYENAVNYLIKLSKAICNSTTGVPQGPAYARYLAELYLASLDEFLVSKLDTYFDFACRYVDDYYIFIKDIDKGKKLKDDLIIELDKMYLETNDKLKYGILGDIKYDIEIVNQVEKYFVDGLDDSTPIQIKREAKKILNSMFKDFVKNDDMKNFPFFLTHLWDEEYVREKCDIIVEKMRKTSVGRGNLFKHFYNKIATKYTLLEFYNEVKGLSRANLITSLMRNESCGFNEYSNLVNTYLLKTDLTNYEKRELLRLVLLKNVDFNVNILKKSDYQIIIDLIKTVPEITWDEQLFDEIIVSIQDISIKIDAIQIIEAILGKSKNIPNNKMLVELIYAIFKMETFEDVNVFQIQSMFNVVAYATLFLDNNNRVSELWKKVLKFETDNIQANKWMKFNSIIDKDTINTTTVTAVLIQLFNEDSYVELKSAYKIEKEFAYYLFLELSNSKLATKLDVALYDLVKKVALEQNALSLSWCCESDSSYYPDSETSARNIEFNNRVVLKKGNKLLVRGPADMFTDNDYNTENIHESIKMHFKLFEINNTLKSYTEKIFNENFVEIMCFSIDMIRLIKKELVNIFEKGTLIEENSKVNFTYSKADKQFILNKTEKINVNEDVVIDQMIKEISKTEWSHIFTDANFEIKNNQFMRIVIPDHLFKSNLQARIKYFEKLCKSIKDFMENDVHEKLSLHAFESMKLDALANCVKILPKLVSSNVREMKESFGVLSLYNKFYKNPDNAILYSKEIPNYKNLAERIFYFRQSISKNLDSRLIRGLLHDIEGLEIKFKSKFGDLENYIKSEVRVIESSNINSLEINGESTLIEDLQIIIFDGIFEEKEISDNDLLSLNISDMYKNDSIVVILPDEFTKSMEISSRKSNEFDLSTLNKSSVIKSCNEFDACVNNIMCQGGVSITKEIAEGRLIKFLENKSSEYHDSVLRVISRYRYFENSEYQDFRENLIKLLKKSQISTFTLKNHIADNNGFNILIEDKYPDAFGRGKEYDIKLKDSIKKFFKGEKKDSIAIVSDIGISGSQFENTIKDYITKSGTYNSGKLHKYEGEFFEDRITNSSKIIILNCLYTDVYERNVSKFLRTQYKVDNIEFWGSKLLVDGEHSYLKVHENDRLKFKEFISKYYPERLAQKVASNYMTYKEYLEIADKDEYSDLDKCMSLMVLRHKSMPKYHHKVFADTIYEYRRD